MRVPCFYCHMSLFEVLNSQVFLEWAMVIKGICKKTFSKREVVNLVFRLALNSWWMSEALWKPASETQLAQGGTAELCLQNGNLNVLSVSSQCNIF